MAYAEKHHNVQGQTLDLNGKCYTVYLFHLLFCDPHSVLQLLLMVLRRTIKGLIIIIVFEQWWDVPTWATRSGLVDKIPTWLLSTPVKNTALVPTQVWLCVFTFQLTSTLQNFQTRNFMACWTCEGNMVTSCNLFGTLDGGRNPSFNETFKISLIEGLREVQAHVWNSNTLERDDYIGSTK